MDSLITKKSCLSPGVQKVKNLHQISWELNKRCNFRCRYCFHSAESLSREHRDCGSCSPAKIVHALNITGLTWHLHLSGGEPFLYPDFIRMCQSITTTHFISVNTNLSLPTVRSFAHGIDPGRVLFINAAYHIEEREKYTQGKKNFIRRVILLQELGFNVEVEYIAYPPLLQRLEKDIRFLHENGVNAVKIKAFRGVYRKKLYPRTYSTQQYEWIEKYPDNSVESKIFRNQYSFFGKQCTAGVDFYRMDLWGNIFRCASSKRTLGNLFKHTFHPGSVTKSCPFIKCACPYEGFRSVEGINGTALQTIGEIFREWPEYIARRVNMNTFRKHLRSWIGA